MPQKLPKTRAKKVKFKPCSIVTSRLNRSSSTNQAVVANPKPNQTPSKTSEGRTYTQALKENQIKQIAHDCQNKHQFKQLQQHSQISRATLYRWRKLHQSKPQKYRRYKSGADHYRTFPSFVPKFILTLATQHPNWSVKTIHQNLKTLGNGRKLVSYGYIQKLLEKTQLSIRQARIKLSRQLKKLTLLHLTGLENNPDEAPINKLLSIRLYSKTTTPPNDQLVSTDNASFLTTMYQLWGRNL